MKTEIARYKPEHRGGVRRIVWETGFGGKRVDHSFDDPEWFSDMNSLYYTDFDDTHNFVALADGKIVGYLLGCPDTALYEKRFKSEVAPLMLRKLLTGKYKLSRKNLSFLRKIILTGLRGELTASPIDDYPAHLHIDFDEPFRRMGLGSRIMNEYFDYLRGLGVKGVHLGTSSFHRSALPFYAKLGFTINERVRTTERFYPSITQEDMYSICYVKKL
jgi:GNAT superfamily N-acetyltransferase